MITLFDTESRSPAQLPASRFPEWADLYICDVCGRDVKASIHRVRGHAGPSIGPERFTCGCGARYLSGMTEWDHLHRITRKSRTQGLMWAPIFIVLPATLLVLLIQTAIQRHSVLLGVVAGMEGLVGLPFELFGIASMLDMPSIIASIWRTRFSKSGNGSSN